MRVVFEVKASEIPGLQRNGKFLCSSRDPVKEAKAWVHSYAKYLAHAKRVIVLGCGAGFHLSELLNAYPQLIIEVVEFETDLFHKLQVKDSRFQNSQQVALVSKELASKNQLVLEFKPSWVDFEKAYQEISKDLLDYQLSDIKTISQKLSIDDQSVDAKIWRALREMVQ